MSSAVFSKIARGLKEALLIAKGLKTPARLHASCEIARSVKDRRRKHEDKHDMGAKVTKHRTQL